jgi:hypothetical protein
MSASSIYAIPNHLNLLRLMGIMLNCTGSLQRQHFNFYGRYQLDSDTPPVDIAEIVRELAMQWHP